VIVIPARYASTRLPGKPLRDIAGLTMIERVVTQGLQSSATQVVVATDHPEIAKVLEGKVEVIMTHAEATSGTDRVAEAVSALKLEDERSTRWAQDVDYSVMAERLAQLRSRASKQR